jgi:dihydroorotate dehydrogenase electron transfer subunit
VSSALFGRRALTVTAMEELGAYRVLRVADPHGPDGRSDGRFGDGAEAGWNPIPGQFAMIAAVERWGGGEDERPYLPRAFSIARHAHGESHFLLEDVGPGTRRLCELRAGEEMWALGPLGHGFSLGEPESDRRRAVLVGGGVGIAPLAILQDTLAASAPTARTPAQDTGAEHTPAQDTPAQDTDAQDTDAEHTPAVGVTVLLGFRDRARAEGAALLHGARVATDDGSVGHHGLVTDLLAEELGREPNAVVYACGPAGMLEGVRALCEQRDVPAQLALEAGMACGFGACFGCVVPRRDGGYLRVCLDGPVVDAAQLEHVDAHAGGVGGT